MVESIPLPSETSSPPPPPYGPKLVQCPTQWVHLTVFTRRFFRERGRIKSSRLRDITLYSVNPCLVRTLPEVAVPKPIVCARTFRFFFSRHDRFAGLYRRGDGSGKKKTFLGEIVLFRVRRSAFALTWGGGCGTDTDTDSRVSDFLDVRCVSGAR